MPAVLMAASRRPVRGVFSGFISSLIWPLGYWRSFRSDAALEAIAKASKEKVPNVVLYNYPSFSGAYSALFAHLYHSRLNLPCLILPFSSIVPFRAEDFYVQGIQRCYLLDFLGPQGFVDKLLLKTASKVVCFDHRKSTVANIQSREEKLNVHRDTTKSSSRTVYEYFSTNVIEVESHDGITMSLSDTEDKDRIETVLNYLDDMDLRRWSLSDTKAFGIGLKEWRSKINCITNPDMYEQLIGISSNDLITVGNSYILSREIAALKFLELNKVFKVRLGRGFYGDCLGVRADGSHHLSDELCKLLSIRSAAAGLRGIGAVTFIQRNNNLKMCLRSTDATNDTSEVAKVHVMQLESLIRFHFDFTDLIETNQASFCFSMCSHMVEVVPRDPALSS